MKPSKVRRALLRRLAYLEVSLELGEMSDDARDYREEERDAMRHVLEKLDLLDVEALDRYIAKTREWFPNRTRHDASSAA